MATTPWQLRVTDPVWRSDHDYPKGFRITGSDGKLYICKFPCGPNVTETNSDDPNGTAAGTPVDPTDSTLGTYYWESLADSLGEGGSNELASMTADTSGNAATATALQTARTIDGVSFDGTANITHYGTCSTAAGTAAKTVSLTGFTLTTGAVVHVKFSNANTASNPTLNVNSTGAKNIQYNGANVASSSIVAGAVYTFIYTGSVWEMTGDVTTTSVQSGDSTLNTSFDNLTVSGKYFVTTTANTTNAPMSVAASWWVSVSTYISGSTTYVLQEARMHSTASGSATAGAGHLLARCGTGSTWGPWHYSYTQFAG